MAEEEKKYKRDKIGKAGEEEKGWINIVKENSLCGENSEIGRKKDRTGMEGREGGRQGTAKGVGYNYESWIANIGQLLDGCVNKRGKWDMKNKPAVEKMLLTRNSQNDRQIVIRRAECQARQAIVKSWDGTHEVDPWVEYGGCKHVRCHNSRASPVVMLCLKRTRRHWISTVRRHDMAWAWAWAWAWIAGHRHPKSSKEGLLSPSSFLFWGGVKKREAAASGLDYALLLSWCTVPERPRS